MAWGQESEREVECVCICFYTGEQSLHPSEYVVVGLHVL